jgi:hypothetical protein
VVLPKIKLFLQSTFIVVLFLSGETNDSIDGRDCDTTGKLGVVNYPEQQSAKCAARHTQSIFLNDDCNPYVAPNGTVFCNKKIRHGRFFILCLNLLLNFQSGILPLIVKEMLETRLMIKRSMKKYNGPDNKVLQRVLDARQLAVKLLSNVTCNIVLFNLILINKLNILKMGILQQVERK